MTDARFPADTFPRQHARTRRFSLGRPRSIAVADDGSRVTFLRSRSGDDPVGSLWVFDVEDLQERSVVGPEMEGEEHISDAERDRRERLRETLTGVTAYAADRALTVAAVAMGDRLFLADLVEGGARELQPAAGPPFDPRPDPTGTRIAYVADGALRVLDVASGDDRALASDDDPDVSWGLPDFIAAEEMERRRGYWWSPEGDRIAAARVDDRPVRIWHIAGPVDPEASPRAVRYPAAGTDNAIVTLSVFDMQGSRVDVGWDVEAFPYLVTVEWSANAPLTFVVQSRDQKTWQILSADPATGKTTLVREDHDDRWLHILPGVPGYLADGRLVRTLDSEDTRRLTFDDVPVTPVGLQVEEVVEIGDDHVLFRATDDPTELHVWRVGADGALTRITEEPGIHTATQGGDVLVVSSAPAEGLPASHVLRDGEEVGTLRSLAEEPLLVARPRFSVGGARELRTALLTPGGTEPDGPIPVLLDPYGGPHFGRVVKAGLSFLESQWFADQGFAVLVIDGRGTPGRGPGWEREVYRDLADSVLQDQIDGLHAAAEVYPFLDLERVAIRGWSFGGFLAAMAVLRRPDVFHAAVSGAPVTDGELYDTHYTERYLGMPDIDVEAYARYRLLDDAPSLRRPLLLIHGLADDNVYVANTLRLSRALMEAGRFHSVIPLSGITHAPSQPEVAENLLLLQVRFLRDALGLPDPDLADPA
ncbi:MAG: prolyl oligopeptidase family serine peptidase [Actinomycetota bacterium]